MRKTLETPNLIAERVGKRRPFGWQWSDFFSLFFSCLSLFFPVSLYFFRHLVCHLCDFGLDCWNTFLDNSRDILDISRNSVGSKGSIILWKIGEKVTEEILFFWWKNCPTTLLLVLPEIMQEFSTLENFACICRVERETSFPFHARNRFQPAPR